MIEGEPKLEPEEILKELSKEEIKKRIFEFKNFCSNCTLDEKKLLFVEYEGFLAKEIALVFLEIKPFMSIIPRSFVRYDLDNFFKKAVRQNERSFTYYNFGNLSILANILKCQEIIKNNPEVFSDEQIFDETKNNKDLLSLLYKSMMSYQLQDGKTQEGVKAGLLFGFPKQVVMSWKEATDKGSKDTLKSYHSHDINFLYNEDDPKDIEAINNFSNKIKSGFKLSGIKDFITAEKNKLTNH